MSATTQRVGKQGSRDLPHVNGVSGPIEIVGARPCGMLKVEILGVDLDARGYTSLWPGIGMVPDRARRKAFGSIRKVPMSILAALEQSP